MSHCKKHHAHFVLTFMFLLLIGSVAMAGTEDWVGDDVKFRVTSSAAYTWGTVDQTWNHIATVEFQVAFDDAEAGYLEGAVMKFEFDTDYLTFAEARPASGWGATTPALDVSAGNPSRITYAFDGTSTLPISEDWVTLAEFDFHVECQVAYPYQQLDIIHGLGETTVDDGTDIHYVATPLDRIFEGTIHRYLPIFTTWIHDDYGQVEMPGILGTQLDLPVIAGGPFRMGGADFTIGYDNTKLSYVDFDDLDPTFTGYTVSFPAAGQVRFQLETDEAIISRRQFASEPMLDMQFQVIGDWEGGSTQLTWVGTPIFDVAQLDGICNVGWGSHWEVPLTIIIPNYEAAFSTVFADGGTISLVDDDVTFGINLTNSFPAGGAANAIIANMRLDPELSAVMVDPGPDWGMHVYPTAGGQDVGLRLETSSFWDMSATAEPLVSFGITKAPGFEPPTEFDNRFYPIAYKSTYDATSYDANVTDTTAMVETSYPGDLLWDQPEVEYLMGEYYCNYASAGQGHVDQNYYTRTAFDLHDFRVKIMVSGQHHMYDIDPEDGVYVESFDNVAYKWAILATDASWVDQTATDSRTKFATITYAYTGGSVLLAKETGDLDDPADLQGPGGGGYYITKLSTVTFEDADPGVYYMNDPGDNEHHQVSIGNTVRSRWYVDYLDPYDNIKLTGLGIPEDYALAQNYPNPFNPATEIVFGLPEASRVELSVYNIRGQRVTTLVDGWMDAGVYTRSWSGADVASGVYFYRLRAGDYVESRKMVLLK